MTDLFQIMRWVELPIWAWTADKKINKIKNPDTHDKLHFYYEIFWHSAIADISLLSPRAPTTAPGSLAPHLGATAMESEVFF